MMKNIFILQLVDLCVTPPVCVVYFYCHTLERHVLFFIVLQQSQPGMMRLPKFGILIIYTFTRISFNVLSFIFFKLCTTCRLCKFSSRVMQVIIAISQCFHKAYIKTKKHTHTHKQKTCTVYVYWMLQCFLQQLIMNMFLVAVTIVCFFLYLHILYLAKKWRQ